MSNIHWNSGDNLHIIDLTGFHVPSVLIRKLIFVLDFPFCTGPDLLIGAGRTHKETRRTSTTNTLTSLREEANISPSLLNRSSSCRDRKRAKTVWGSTRILGEREAGDPSPSASRCPPLSCCWPRCLHHHCRRWNSHLQPAEPFYPEGRKRNKNKTKKHIKHNCSETGCCDRETKKTDLWCKTRVKIEGFSHGGWQGDWLSPQLIFTCHPSGHGIK